MKIHRTNHTRPSDNFTNRIQVYPEHTENFKISCDSEGSVTIHARCFDYDWDVTLSKEETEQLRRCLRQ